MHYAIVTLEQLAANLTAEACAYVGYTEEILEAAGFANGITLEQALIEIEGTLADGRKVVKLNLANAGKLPRKVAIYDVTPQDVAFWQQAVGEENVIEDISELNFV